MKEREKESRYVRNRKRKKERITEFQWQQQRETNNYLYCII